MKTWIWLQKGLWPGTFLPEEFHCMWGRFSHYPLWPPSCWNSRVQTVALAYPLPEGMHSEEARRGHLLDVWRNVEWNSWMVSRAGQVFFCGDLIDTMLRLKMFVICLKEVKFSWKIKFICLFVIFSERKALVNKIALGRNNLKIQRSGKEEWKPVRINTFWYRFASSL